MFIKGKFLGNFDISFLGEVLSEKGLLAKKELLDRIRKLQTEGQEKRQKTQ